MTEILTLLQNIVVLATCSSATFYEVKQSLME